MNGTPNSKSVRACVSAYVFLTGWGNTIYFKKTNDYSMKRFAGMMWRIGGFCPLLSAATGTPFILYYIVVLHSAHFALVFVFGLE